MALSVGETAPDFILTTIGADGPELYTLSENTSKNNTLILFIPMAFTGGCTEELCSVTSSIDKYTELDAQVIAISGDNPFAQAAWAEKEGIKLTLLSDYEHEVAYDYDVAYESFIPEKNLMMGGVSKRSAFIVDREGVIQYAESQESPSEMPDFEAIQAKLKELE